MATLTVDAPARVVECAPARVRPATTTVRRGRRTTATPWGLGSRDQLVIVEAVTENRLAELRSAVIDKPTWVLNGVGSMAFHVPADDPTLLDCLVDPDSVQAGAGKLKLLGREAQFWRDGELRWAGPVTSADVSLRAGVVSFQCQELPWYITAKKFMGAAERVDWLDGIGSMDVSGLPGWTRNTVTATRDTTTKKRGAGSARLIGEGSISATFTVPALTSGQATTVLLTVLAKLSTATAVGQPIASIQAYPTGESTPYNPTAVNFAEVDDDTVLGSWTRFTCRCSVKAGVVNTVRVGLFSGSGAHSTWFDDVRALRNDTTGYSAPGEDLTTHGYALINHAQSVRKGGGFGFGVLVLANTGTVEPMGVRHLEHTQLGDLFDAYVSREDGWDWWVDPKRRRFVFAPRRGVDHTDIALSDRSALSGGWTHDETNVASSIVVIGEGDGVERPEGGYENTSRTAGLSLDYLHRPPNSTPLSALDPMAQSLWEQMSQPQTTPKPVTVPADWWPDLTPGDRFPNHLTCGVVRPATSDDGLRVQKIVHDLDADVLELS